MLSVRDPRFFLAAVALLAAACAEDGGELEGDGADEQAIRSGVPDILPGLMEIKFGDRRCSGVGVGPTVVATSASCFDGVSFDDVGLATVDMKLNASDHNGSLRWRCTTSSPTGSTGKCAESRPLTVRRMAPSGDEANDFAVIVDATASFPHVAGLYTGAIEIPFPVVLWGTGPGDYDGSGGGNARSLAETVDWASGKHFVIDTDNMRLCRGGDEGAPALKDSQWLAGTFLTASEWSSRCAKVGSKQRFTRINTAKVNFINGALSAEGAFERCRATLTGDFFDCAH